MRNTKKFFYEKYKQVFMRNTKKVFYDTYKTVMSKTRSLRELDKETKTYSYQNFAIFWTIKLFKNLVSIENLRIRFIAVIA